VATRGGAVARVLSIVGYSPANVGIYRDQVRSLFKDAIEIRVFVIGAWDRAGIENADLVLFTSFDAMQRTLGDSVSCRDVIFASRTVSKKGFDLVASLGGGGSGSAEEQAAGPRSDAGDCPGRSDVLLVDETLPMAEQMVATLRQAGLRSPRLRAAAQGSLAYSASDALVILGEKGYDTGGAGMVLDIGNSLLDVPTILDIGFRLGLGHMLNRQNIRENYREIMTTNIGLSEVLSMTNRFEGFLDILLQSLDSGIVGVGVDGKIFLCNEKARSLFGVGPGSGAGQDFVQGSGIGASAREAFPQIPFETVLREKTPLRDRIARTQGGDVVYSVDPILHSGVLYGAVAVFGRFGEDERKQHRIRTLVPERGHRARYTFADIIGSSPALLKRKDMARRMAESVSSVLITGESGTGKEMFAQAIHNASPRRDFQFVAVNCGALPESLLESELFGYEEGAFTGARKGGKPGLFELAHRGTLFLDEIGDMPQNLQMRLLRVLEERQVMRLGGGGVIGIDIRVIAASNRNLGRMVAEGGFREDLYYRLNVLPIHIPPLRERREDIMPLVKEFQRLFGVSFGMAEDVEEFFLRQGWKGNARELRNYVEFIANLGVQTVGLADLPVQQGDAPGARVEAGLRDDDASPGTQNPDPVRRTEARSFILAELRAAYGERKRLGRRTLCERARELSLFMSEREIRQILAGLEREGFVEIRPGKGGTVLTRAGFLSQER
jgi:transcriptional regulator with PAS, ATPase and Fis domain